jgi:F0F1-type ATP synthase assembly protein I
MPEETQATEEKREEKKEEAAGAGEQKPEKKEEPKRHISSNTRRLLAVEFAVFGVVVGVVSFLLNSYPYARTLALVTMIIMGAVVTYGTKRALKEKVSGTGKWWASPLIIYIFMWLIAWTILFNIYTVKPF